MKVMAAGHRYWPEFPRRPLAVGLFARFQHGGRTATRAVGIAGENEEYCIQGAPVHRRRGTADKNGPEHFGYNPLN